MSYTKEEQAANRARWVEALRSGEYKQVKGALRGVNRDGDPVGYCCLGVACELASKEGVVERRENAYGSPGDLFYGDSESTALPHPVRRWLGIGIDGDLKEEVRYESAPGIEDHTQTLIGLNDSVGYTFEQIADVIENDGIRLLNRGE